MVLNFGMVKQKRKAAGEAGKGKEKASSVQRGAAGSSLLATHYSLFRAAPGRGQSLAAIFFVRSTTRLE
jgi:hypothetical protein